MRSSRLFTGLVVAALGCPLAVAHAQVVQEPATVRGGELGTAASPRALLFGLSGGVSLASEGRWDRGYAGGVHAQLSVEAERLAGPLGLRADAFVHRFTREAFGTALSRHTSVPGAAASLVLPVGRSLWPVRPYLLGGLGGYRTEYGSRPEWHFGTSGGAGVRFRLAGVNAFTEVRLHDIADGSTPRLVPVSFGFHL